MARTPPGERNLTLGLAAQVRNGASAGFSGPSACSLAPQASEGSTSVHLCGRVSHWDFALL